MLNSLTEFIEQSSYEDFLTWVKLNPTIEFWSCRTCECPVATYALRKYQFPIAINYTDELLPTDIDPESLVLEVNSNWINSVVAFVDSFFTPNDIFTGLELYTALTEEYPEYVIVHTIIQVLDKLK